MKSLISELRNKKLKGNVSLLIILILLASSVIALLSINQIQRLLTYGNMTFNYFRAFYLAKAGTELGLTEVYYREAGFQQTINSGDTVVTENLVGVYSGFNPYFTMDIEGKFEYLTDDVRYTTKNDCTDDNKITLGTGEGIMLSLFSDETKSFNEIFTGTEDEKNLHSDNDLIKKLKMVNVEKQGDFKYFMFGLFDYDKNGDMKNIFVETGDSSHLTSKFLGHIDGSSIKNSKRKYLTIKNPGTGNGVVSFCIGGKGDIPYSDSLITVRGNYGDMEVGLQSVVKKDVPSWSMNVLDLYDIEQ